MMSWVSAAFEVSVTLNIEDSGIHTRTTVGLRPYRRPDTLAFSRRRTQHSLVASPKHRERGTSHRQWRRVASIREFS